MKGSARGNWDPREGQQPLRPKPNGVGDRTTTLRQLLIGAVCMLSCSKISVTADMLFVINRLVGIVSELTFVDLLKSAVGYH